MDFDAAGVAVVMGHLSAGAVALPLTTAAVVGVHPPKSAVLAPAAAMAVDFVAGAVVCQSAVVAYVAAVVVECSAVGVAAEPLSVHLVTDAPAAIPLCYAAVSDVLHRALAVVLPPALAVEDCHAVVPAVFLSMDAVAALAETAAAEVERLYPVHLSAFVQAGVLSGVLAERYVGVAVVLFALAAVLMLCKAIVVADAPVQVDDQGFAFSRLGALLK